MENDIKILWIIWNGGHFTTCKNMLVQTAFITFSSLLLLKPNSCHDANFVQHWHHQKLLVWVLPIFINDVNILFFKICQHSTFITVFLLIYILLLTFMNDADIFLPLTNFLLWIFCFGQCGIPLRTFLPSQKSMVMSTTGKLYMNDAGRTNLYRV